MNKVLPSILGAKETEKFLGTLERLRKEEKTDINAIHVDIMDGIFVENKCLDISDITIVKDKGFIADVHLMVEKPEELILQAIELGAENITIHYEIEKFFDVLRFLLKCREKHNIGIGVSICPETNVSVLEPILSKIDSVLLMSVHPGKGGQVFMDSTYSKITNLRILSDKVRIVVDGGVNNTNIQKIIYSGADNVVVGSYITSNMDDIENIIKSLEKRGIGK